MSSNRVPIRYREFWDVPRIFRVTYQGALLLFDYPFDEETEDYPDWNQVYLLPRLGEEELAGSWAQLARKAVRPLGKVPITQVRFDPTKRQSVDATLLDGLTARKSVAG
jgi:hypothetical protein